MKPEKKDVAVKIMNDEERNLANTCDPAKLAKCKEYMLKQAADAVKTNGYWLGIINSYNLYGNDSHTDYTKIVEALTTQDICTFMKEFNKGGNQITVMMLPE